MSKERGRFDLGKELIELAVRNSDEGQDFIIRHSTLNQQVRARSKIN